MIHKLNNMIEAGKIVTENEGKLEFEVHERNTRGAFDTFMIDGLRKQGHTVNITKG